MMKNKKLLTFWYYTTSAASTTFTVTSPEYNHENKGPQTHAQRETK